MNINKLILPVNITEDEIISSWKFSESIYVSFVCTTFNQEDYIEDTINSMLSQVTDYRFEIVIHDDCSKDNTRNILVKYKNRFPSIIKLILQKENQYSKGKKIIPLAVSYATGKFIALCEGDDFWCDDLKIQKQIEVLNKYNSINFVISRAISLYPNGSTSIFCDLGNEKKHISFPQCISSKNKDFFPTASFFMRKEIFSTLPDWLDNEAPVADYYIQLYASNSKGAIYLPDITSVYRRNAKGSWSNLKSLDRVIADKLKRSKCMEFISDEFKYSDCEVINSITEKKIFYYKVLAFCFLKRFNFLKSLLFTIKFSISLLELKIHKLNRG